MKNHPFELSLVGRVEDTATSTVTLQHQKTFKVALTNHLPGGRRCIVRLSFNGQDVGEFRVHGGQTVVIKRPVHDDAPFTFLQVGTADAKAAGLPLDGTAGLLRAVFVPESSAADRLRVEHDAELPSSGPTFSKEEAAELRDAFGLGSEHLPPTEPAVFTVALDGSFQEADDIFTLEEAAAVEIEVRLQGQPDEHLSLDAFDVYADEVAWLEYRAEKACAEFDYDLAFKLDREVRARERELLRHCQAEIGDVR